MKIYKAKNFLYNKRNEASISVSYAYKTAIEKKHSGRLLSKAAKTRRCPARKRQVCSQPFPSLKIYNPIYTDSQPQFTSFLLAFMIIAAAFSSCA